MDPQQVQPQQPQQGNQNTQSQVGQQVYTSPSNGSASQPRSKFGSKKLYALIGAGVGVLALILLVAVLASGDGKNNTAQNPTVDEARPQLLEPSSALDIEQINNSISQDMSNLSNDRDFPADQLDDKALGL